MFAVVTHISCQLITFGALDRLIRVFKTCPSITRVERNSVNALFVYCLIIFSEKKKLKKSMKLIYDIPNLSLMEM